VSLNFSKPQFVSMVTNVQVGGITGGGVVVPPPVNLQIIGTMTCEQSLASFCPFYFLLLAATGSWFSQLCLLTVINLCAGGLSPLVTCSQTFTPANYTCAPCPHGYGGNSHLICSDINECLVSK